MRELYARGPLDEANLVERTTGALRALARSFPEEDWSTFRLLAR